MAKERLATYSAVGREAILATATGIATVIDLNVPLGTGARVIRAEFIGGRMAQEADGAGLVGLSLDPTEAIPPNIASVIDNLDVLFTWRFENLFTTNGLSMVQGNFGIDLTPYNILVARNMSMIARNDTGGNFVDFAIKLLFRLVELTDAEMAEVLARQR